MGKKDKPTIKSISFPAWYQRELDFLESQKNMSEYVCNLIRQDMERRSESQLELTQKQIERMVQEQVMKQLIALNTAPQKPPVVVDDTDVDQYFQ